MTWMNHSVSVVIFHISEVSAEYCPKTRQFRMIAFAQKRSQLNFDLGLQSLQCALIFNSKF